ncbi:BlaI/MecI/CopY family transcriptional regulator [Kineococcus gynurae]|uniref:BlaI/MecI/CopY family transcriptional regulator n=1 Tax=Kineococcus gynurae TaxID=452979 RepID=A0ABV5LR78_9ACTN
MALGELEREVMDRLWAAGTPLTVREVHEELAAHRKIAYTTVMTVLDRLAKKSVVRQERAGRAFRYSPAASREQMVAEVMMDALGDVPSDDRQAALVHFVGSVSPAELAALREALDAMAPGATPAATPGTTQPPAEPDPAPGS